MSNGKKNNYAILILCLALLAVFVLVALLSGKGEAERKSELAAKKAVLASRNVSEPSSSPTQAPEQAEADAFKELAAEARSILNDQREVDASLLKELDSHEYTFEEPLVVTDPYGKSPLTALALFETQAPAKISLSIAGKTARAEIDFYFTEYGKRHIVPIYGLYAGQENTVTLTASMEDGTEKENVLSIHTEALPQALADLDIITRLSLPNDYSKGLNFMYTPKAAYDINGDFRWFLNDFSLLRSQSESENGRIWFAKGSTLEGAVLLYDMDLLGRVYNVYYSPYGVHHDIARLESGNLLVTGSDNGADNRGSVQDIIYEIDTASGEIINTMDLGEILQRTRAVGRYFVPHDWFHQNSIVPDKDGAIIISGRHQSAVVKLKWPEGDIDWILSMPEGWSELFRPYLLTAAGGGFEWQVYQHTPTILPDLDNNPDTIDILLLDNGTDRFYHDGELRHKIETGKVAPPENFSRAVHYRINEKTMQVEQVWQFGKELGQDYYSQRCGNAMRLNNGSVLISFDVSKEISVNEEQAATIYNNSCIEVLENGEIVWESYISNGESYSGSYENFKTVRGSLYGKTDEEYSLLISPGDFIPEKEVVV